MRQPFSLAVQRLEVWDRVRVQLPGEVVHGSVAWASEHELALRVKKDERRLPCDEILWFQKTESRAPATGFVIGMLLAIVPTYNACDNLWCGLAGLGVFGGIGAGIGASAGGAPTVFEASPGWCHSRVSDKVSRD